MNQKGFISSALLYGMLALFLVIMASTLAILANKKISLDKVKESALNNIQYGYAEMENIYALYDGFQSPNQNKWKDQSSNNNDATLVDFLPNAYQNRHLNFSGSSYLNTGIKQSELGNKITISTVINIQNTAGTIGLWGYYSESEGNGIYAQTNNGIINICYYTKSKTPLCVDIGKEFFTEGAKENQTYLGKIIQLTVVMESKVGIDVYINDMSYDRIESTEEINPRGESFIIGASNSQNSNRLQADIYNFTIYNTALTYEDIIKNFEANKQRYNINS